MIGKLIKWALLGIGALVVLAVVVGVLAVVMGGGGGGAAGGEGGGQAVNGTADSAGSANGKDYLELGGTPGIPVSCSVMHGDGRQTTIDAKVPQEIRLKGMDSFGSSTYN